jgi:hypothetical protein
MAASLPDAIVSKIMDHYREGLHGRMEARAERLRATFREFASATDEFELREWDANGLNSTASSPMGTV